MAVTFVDSTQSGSSDTLGTTDTVAVPAGAAVGDIALLGIEVYQGAGEAAITMSWPSGFTQILNHHVTAGDPDLQLFIAKKTLTAADTGNYVSTLSASRWHESSCVLIRGAASVSAPQGDTSAVKEGSGTTITATSVTTTAAPFLANFVMNGSASTHTAPTSFTETEEGEYITVAYRIPGTVGAHTATGATQSTSTTFIAALVAVTPASASADPSIAQNPLGQVPYAVTEQAPWALRDFEPPIPMLVWTGPEQPVSTQDATVSATAIVTTTAMSAPAVQTGSTVAATAIATVAALDASTVTAVTAHTATAIATTTGMPAPAVQTGSVVAATTISTTTAMELPVVGAVTAVSPPSIDTVTALPAPAIQTGSVVSATAIATVTALPAPLVSTGSNALVEAVTVATVTALPAPVVQQGQTVAATSIATVTALPAPAVQQGQTVAATAIATVTAIAALTVGTETVVSPVAVATVTALPAPAIQTGSTVSTTTIATVTTLPAPTVESNVVSGIQGRAYPQSATSASGNVYPSTGGGIIGSVA